MPEIEASRPRSSRELIELGNRSVQEDYLTSACTAVQAAGHADGLVTVGKVFLLFGWLDYACVAFEPAGRELRREQLVAFGHQYAEQGLVETAYKRSGRLMFLTGPDTTAKTPWKHGVPRGLCPGL